MAAHAHLDGSSKKIAVLISLLAACLAIAETLANGAQTRSLSANIEAANLWAFYQAKTIRQTAVRTTSEALDALIVEELHPAEHARLKPRLQSWKALVERWESEPDTGEGRRELVPRARKAEVEREKAKAEYHQFELSSAAFQLSIVLASAAVVTSVGVLVWLAVALGGLGVLFGALGAFAPALLHF